MAGRLINSIFIFLIIAAFVTVCGCITIKEVDYEQYLKDSSFYRPSVTPTPTIGIQTTEILPNKDGSSLSTALDDLDTLNSEGLLSTENMTAFQLIGTGVGIEGKANSWVIGGLRNGEKILYSSEESGWREMQWPGSLAEQEIVFDKIIMPDELFDLNSEHITEYYYNSGSDYSDLFLKDGIYTIAFRNREGISELKFKADTGELI